jgi:hypothetical protein
LGVLTREVEETGGVVQTCIKNVHYKENLLPLQKNNSSRITQDHVHLPKKGNFL